MKLCHVVPEEFVVQAVTTRYHQVQLQSKKANFKSFALRQDDYRRAVIYCRSVYTLTKSSKNKSKLSAILPPHCALYPLFTICKIFGHCEVNVVCFQKQDSNIPESLKRGYEAQCGGNIAESFLLKILCKFGDIFGDYNFFVQTIRNAWAFQKTLYVDFSNFVRSFTMK